jgi:Protein of unknown function (DUF2752)
MTQVTATRASAVTPARRQRMLAPVLTIGALSAVTVALHARDPHTSGSWGFCPSAALGLSCPGCGGLRAVNDLTNGDVVAAASSNLAFVVVLPFLVAGLALWAVSRWRGTKVEVPTSLVRPVAYAGLALLLVFTVLRNLPAGSWLAP